MSRLILLLACAAPALAADARVPASSAEFLRKNCADCHADGAEEGGFAVESLSGVLTADDLDRWVRVIDRVSEGEMPPPDHETLREADKLRFGKDAGRAVAEHQRAEAASLGRVRARKLTGRELERSLQAVLAIDTPLAGRLPEEPRTDLFTTVARGQTMSHFDLANHLEVVEAALDESFRRVHKAHVDASRKKYGGKGRGETWTEALSAEDLARKNPKQRNRQPEMHDGAAVVWSHGLVFYGQIPRTRAGSEGWYRFTVDASALKAPPQGVWCTVRTGECRSSAPAMTDVGVFLATPKKQTFTFEAFLPVGHMFEVRPADGRVKQARTPGGQVGAGECQTQDVPGLAMHSATLQRLHKTTDEEAVEAVLGDEVRLVWDKRIKDFRPVAARPESAVSLRMRKFAARAFRRPVANADVREYIDAAKAQLADGRGLGEVLYDGYRSILCSPRFVYLVEAPGALDDHALAARLSYFLTGGPPDAELTELADAGRLGDDQVLAEQTDRLLAGDGGRRFAEDFAREWLELSEIDFTEPARRLHPTYDRVVQVSLLDETHAYLARMIAEDRPVTEVVDSDTALLNERLAAHYDVPGVKAGELVEVSLKPDDPRGGLLTQGSVLKVTANGTATSPVLRGVWVSERLLGIRVPGPPENVPAVEPDVRGATSIRDLLEKHRSDDACASCHRKVDPAGFALENFDPAGAWRQKYPRGNRPEKGPPIDASYETPDGRFEDVVGFQKLTASKPERLARNLAEHLLAYGTGAACEYADRDAVARTVRRAGEAGWGLRTLIKEVVLSETFRTK